MNETPNEAALAEMRVLLRAFQISKMLEVAASLGLADRVADRPRPVESLSHEAGAHPAMLLRLCRALAAFGIFAVDADGNIAHTSKSQFLRSSHQPTLHHAALYWTMAGNWSAWAALEETIRSGKPAFEAVFGMPNFEYLQAHPDEARVFDAFMQHSPDDRHAAVLDAYDFSGAKLLADVGGGNGGFVRAALARVPYLRAILFDRDAVVANAGASDRLTAEAGDFFERVPPGADVYVLSQILHDWDDDSCLKLLRNCRNAMRPDARMLIVERVLDLAPGKTDATSFLSDMDMMVLFPGAKERTLPEFNALLEQAGFAAARLIPTRSAFSILETRLAAGALSSP